MKELFTLRNSYLVEFVPHLACPPIKLVGVEVSVLQKFGDRAGQRRDSDSSFSDSSFSDTSFSGSGYRVGTLLSRRFPKTTANCTCSINRKQSLGNRSSHCGQPGLTHHESVRNLAGDGIGRIRDHRFVHDSSGRNER